MGETKQKKPRSSGRKEWKRPGDLGKANLSSGTAKDHANQHCHLFLRATFQITKQPKITNQKALVQVPASPFI